MAGAVDAVSNGPLGAAATPNPSRSEAASQFAADERTRFGPGIYLHYPFCKKRCGYCDFFVVLAEESDRAAFVDSLLREIDLTAASGEWTRPFRTIFFGGGTPSLLTGSQMTRILERLHSCFGITPDAEITAECNPESLVPERMREFRDAGVNRISLGVQSMADSELALLDRLHGSFDVERRVEEIRAAGPVQLNLDLIYGLPNAHASTWEESLARVLALAPDHVSAYLLSLEPHVPLARRINDRTAALVMPGDDDAARQYDILRERTAEAGFAQYEISNFARRGAESRHNQNYWVRGDYLGLGPSAHSHLDGRRWLNARSLSTYARSLAEGRLPREGEEIVAAEGAAAEWIFLGLRRMEGIDWRVLEATGIPLEPVRETASRLASEGWVEDSGNRLRLLPPAYFLSNTVFTELLAAF